MVSLSLERVKVTNQIESFACGQVLTIRSSYQWGLTGGGFSGINVWDVRQCCK